MEDKQTFLSLQGFFVIIRLLLFHSLVCYFNIKCNLLIKHIIVNASKKIPWQVQQVHGITNEMLSGEPKSYEVLPEFYKFIAGSILVAHNASFDKGFAFKQTITYS